MKIAAWLSFLAVALTSIAASGWLWAATSIVEGAFNGRPQPLLTTWAFAAQPWVPLACVPWLIAVLALSFRSKVTASAFNIYFAACLLGCVAIAAFALVASILPFKGIFVGLSSR